MQRTDEPSEAERREWGRGLGSLAGVLRIGNTFDQLSKTAIVEMGKAQLSLEAFPFKDRCTKRIKKKNDEKEKVVLRTFHAFGLGLGSSL
jgi:hypothetical protein